MAPVMTLVADDVAATACVGAAVVDTAICVFVTCLEGSRDLLRDGRIRRCAFGAAGAVVGA